MHNSSIFGKIIFLIAFNFILIFFSSCRTSDPAPGCNEFCKFRINITDGENNNKKGFGEFGKNGSPEICNFWYNNWPTFEVFLANPYIKLCTNKNIPLDLNGKTAWFEGDTCITKGSAKKYAKSKVEFRLAELDNEYFTVRGKPGMCPGRCILYKISGLKRDITYKVNKNNCGIDIFIKSTAVKIGSNVICVDCNC